MVGSIVGTGYKYGGHWSSKVMRVMSGVVEGRLDREDECHM